MGLVSVAAIHATQHLYFIIAAPSLFLPLGLVIRQSAVLPRAFGALALALGGLFLLLGVTTSQQLVLPAAVTTLGAVQAVWWLTAAIAFLRSRPTPDTVARTPARVSDGTARDR